MLHAKFQDHRNLVLEVFQGCFHIYGRGSHPSHVTCTIYTFFAPPSIYNWALIGLAVLEMLITVIYMYIARGMGRQPLG